MSDVIESCCCGSRVRGLRLDAEMFRSAHTVCREAWAAARPRAAQAELGDSDGGRPSGPPTQAPEWPDAMRHTPTAAQPPTPPTATEQAGTRDE